MDRGAAGIDATVNALEAAGIDQSGMARTPEEAVPRLFTVNGITFAHLSFTFGLNGASLPPGQPWRSEPAVGRRGDRRRARRSGPRARRW